jgi:hypothetical protein
LVLLYIIFVVDAPLQVIEIGDPDTDTKGYSVVVVVKIILSLLVVCKLP